jgi:hypothetical protein
VWIADGCESEAHSALPSGLATPPPLLLLLLSPLQLLQQMLWLRCWREPGGDCNENGEGKPRGDALISITEPRCAIGTTYSRSEWFCASASIPPGLRSESGLEWCLPELGVPAPPALWCAVHASPGRDCAGLGGREPREPEKRERSGLPMWAGSELE